MSTVIHGPRVNRRVTCDSDPQHARSESDIAVNPLNPYNMVGSSKRFTNITAYNFSLAAYATFDAGQTWTETVLPLTDTNGTVYPASTDPAVAFDDQGNCYIIALPWFGESGPNSGQTIGISVYKSTDGGRTWNTPVLIHSSAVDDKQAVWSDTVSSAHKGNVYTAWDDTGTGGMLFARTTDHGATWKGITVGGVDQPAGTAIPGIFDSFSPELTVAADGTLIITWTGPEEGDTIKFVTSTDGGNTFSTPGVVATGISNVFATLPTTGGWPTLPGGTFRLVTYATCITSGTNLVVAWTDTREGNARIYYRYSTNLGATWEGPASGQPLATGAAASPAAKHDFHPMLAVTPTGEAGCTFYEFGAVEEGEFSQNLIVVCLAVSTDSGASFPNRVTVSDQPWNPALDAPNADANPAVTFIGDYFGLAGSSLGFFPFWTDTRTSIQEMFIARVSVNPADLYMRDGPGDTGNVPSPDAVFWESPDMVVRHQPDGATTFVDQGILPGVTNYVYGRVHNRGPNDAPSVTFSVTVGNFPSLLGLPGSEFWYPQDWYRDDWSTAALRNNHVALGESPAAAVANGQTVILGPVQWPASMIPAEGTWHPCLLGEVRSGNDDSAGGTNGADIPADPADTCPHGSFVYGNNNACQRNLSYAHMPKKREAPKRIELPFIAGSVWDTKARTLELIVNKGHELAHVPMTLRMDPSHLPGHGEPGKPKPPEPCECEPAEIVFTGTCRVIVRIGKCEAGEIITTPGTVWRAYCPEKPKIAPPPRPSGRGGAEAPPSGRTWQLTEQITTVGFHVAAGALCRMTLSFLTPQSLHTDAIVRIVERKDGRFFTGGVSLQLRMT